MHLQWWSVLPFAAMLASIAILPLVPRTAHWWEKQSSQLTIALVLGVPVAIWMWIALGWQVVFASVVEYAQFIALLLALFVVSGAIFLKGDIQATPRNNTLFLAVGGVLASFVGTSYLGGRIYRTGILMYGKKPSLKELWRWLSYK